MTACNALLKSGFDIHCRGQDSKYDDYLLSWLSSGLPWNSTIFAILCPQFRGRGQMFGKILGNYSIFTHMIFPSYVLHLESCITDLMGDTGLSQLTLQSVVWLTQNRDTSGSMTFFPVIEVCPIFGPGSNVSKLWPVRDLKSPAAAKFPSDKC